MWVLMQVQNLDLSRNVFTGTLPAAWSNLTEVRVILLHACKATGLDQEGCLLKPTFPSDGCQS